MAAPSSSPVNLFTQPPRLPLLAPSVLSADFGAMATDCRDVLATTAGGAGPAPSGDLLHLDVMDGHFVPNLTMGPDLCAALRRHLPATFLDVHLMVTDPARFVEPFARAGANHLTFHIEAVPAVAAVADLAGRIRALGLTAGLAINPPTTVQAILPAVHLVDMILVMSVNPGFSGQSFIAPVLDKVRTIRPGLRPDQRMQMDGGIKPANAADVRTAGCDVIVAASAIFSQPRAQWPAVCASLRGDI